MTPEPGAYVVLQALRLICGSDFEITEPINLGRFDNGMGLADEQSCSILRHVDCAEEHEPTSDHVVRSTHVGKQHWLVKFSSIPVCPNGYMAAAPPETIVDAETIQWLSPA